MVKIKAFPVFLLSLSFATFVTGARAQTPDLTCSQPVTLSQKDVAEIVLKQGRKTKETNLQYQELRLAVAQSLAPYQWDFLLTTGYLFDKSVGFNTATFDKQENWVT